MTNHDPVVSYVQTLFARGIETFDRTAKISNNVGGAQVYQLAKWKSANSPISFNNSKFGDVLKELGATLFSLNRIKVDANGVPVKVPGTNKNQRTNSGLMLYTQYGEDGSLARNFASRILEQCPELKGHVAPVIDILEACPQLQSLSKISAGFGNDSEIFINPNKCIILHVSSGSQGSQAYWSYSKTGTTRASLDSLTKANGDISDII